MVGKVLSSKELLKEERREHNQEYCRNPRSQAGSRTSGKEIRRERKVRRLKSGDRQRRG